MGLYISQKEGRIITVFRPQSIVWFASVLPQKMEQVGGWKQKSSDFLKKNAYCQ